jgi:hypothetical protein
MVWRLVKHNKHVFTLRVTEHHNVYLVLCLTNLKVIVLSVRII